MPKFEEGQVWQCRNGRVVEIVKAADKSAFLTVRNYDDKSLGNRFYDGTISLVMEPHPADLLYMMYKKSTA